MHCANILKLIRKQDSFCIINNNLMNQFYRSDVNKANNVYSLTPKHYERKV